MSFADRLDRLLLRAEELRDTLATGIAPGELAKLSKEYSELEPIAEQAAQLRQAERELAEAEAMLADPDMRDMAYAEATSLRERITALTQAVRLALLPKDAADAGNAILEIRAGTGGDEAALFAADLLEMYRRYAEARRWRFEVMDAAENDLGGIREVIAEVSGSGVFARLKYESGVHRVQRVPATEAQGRIHTSTATVAVLPEAEDVDLHIEAKDLRIDTYRASGAGGQHVNKTDSAVRITHIPTNTVVAMQEERSQHRNRDRAMKILRARIYDQQRAEKDAARAAQRKSQVGGAERSEKIRTYNFPQNRLTDHRIGFTLHKLDRVILGELDEVVDALAAVDEGARLAEADA
jgi:peptide chain release factor 1